MPYVRSVVYIYIPTQKLKSWKCVILIGKSWLKFLSTNQVIIKLEPEEYCKNDKGTVSTQHLHLGNSRIKMPAREQSYRAIIWKLLCDYFLCT